eukprot:gene7857-8707_t
MAVKIEGPLSKWTNVVKGWQYRWFVLDENTGLLSYYTSKDKMMRGARRGCLRLRGAQIGIDDEDDSTFTISSDQKTFHFQARDATEREQWIKELEETINCHTKSDKTLAFSVPTEEELNHRMAEAEAYFRILTQQVKNLEKQIAASNSERCKLLKDSMTKMIESVGQTLELLNVARSTMLKKIPVPIITDLQPPTVESTLKNKNSENLDNDLIKAAAMSNKNNQPTAVDSDEFAILVDATGQTQKNEEFAGDIEAITSTDGQALSSITAATRPVDDADTLSKVDNEANAAFSNNGEAADITAEYDSINLQEEKIRTVSYCEEDDDHADDEGGGSVQEHGSVITHLLSQVRIGMDLTKVTLPTFILERRSLLEMYADFFAHPDIFKGIPDLKEPKDRMIQVLKWYLSSFHAGRKGSLAKKPYNPILGEMFICNYDLTEQKTQNKDDFVSDGPVHGATKEDVAFVAEQVSHHPPISAFYAECFNKRVCFDSYIWTKSKFLGLSIGVNMVGQGTAYILDHDEEYVMTFPNGYGRSILTVPWVELGGKTEIICQKTGYVSNIEFHTKPFYGGKKHRITAEVFAPGEKKPLVSVNGEWNGVMYATYPGQKEPEVFVDTFNMPVVKKKVVSVPKQQPYESRRMWQDVTKNLKIGNIEQATAGKHKLEEKQRADAKERKEKNEKWQNRVFHEKEHGVFGYKYPLWKRL